MQEASDHAEDDRKLREMVEMKNNREGLIYATHKSMDEFGDRLEDEDKKIIEEKLKKAEEIVKSEDYDSIKKTNDELSEAAHKLAEALYSQAAQKPEKS